ncbi:MAG: amidohydrolase family protein, partial [Alphaproteobacteria bacterium]|nr:amidohydrolase family protein [Alphaproteobacteria bacterium]
AAQAGARTTGKVYVPAERISVEEAVNAYTRNGAYAAFADKYTGTLEAGKEADLVILSEDIFHVAPEAISSARVMLTMVGGKVVYGAAP